MCGTVAVVEQRLENPYRRMTMKMSANPVRLVAAIAAFVALAAAPASSLASSSPSMHHMMACTHHQVMTHHTKHCAMHHAMKHTK